MSALFFGNLHYHLSDSSFRDFIESFGFKVKHVAIVYEKGIGTVTFNSEQDALAAKDILKGKKIMGRDLRVEFVKPRNAR